VAVRLLAWGEKSSASIVSVLFPATACTHAENPPVPDIAAGMKAGHTHPALFKNLLDTCVLISGNL
jgi:hypothetical protein